MAREHVKKRRRSLGKAMRRQVLLVAVIVFIAATALMGYFSRVELETILSISGQTNASFSGRMISRTAGLEEYIHSILAIYHGIPEEIRLRQNSEEYRSYFSDFDQSSIVESLDEQYDSMQDDFLVERVYLFTYDPDTNANVYLYCTKIGPGEIEWQIGEWEEADPEDLAYYQELLSDEDGVHSYIQEDAEGNKLISSGVPFYGRNGEVIAYTQTDLSTAGIKATAVIMTVFFFTVLLLIIILVSVLSRIRINRRIVKPIRSISEAAERYSQAKKRGNTESNCFENLQIRTGDELEDLSNVMSGMERDIADYEKNLMQVTADRERLQTELSVAASIQTEVLPHCPAFQERRDFRIYASMDPAKEVGGDFYDFFMPDEDHLCLVMADVSGKGIPAALFMMSAMIILQNYASEGYSPAEILQKSNEKICATNRVDMFVTVWLGILDLKTGQLTAANAGHEYPIVRHAGENFHLLKDKHGFVVGGMDGVRYKDYTITLEPGSAIFLYTDGLPEATDKAEKMFGTERVVEALNQVKEKTPEEILSHVSARAEAFVDGAPQFDDLTMLCLVYNGCG